MEPLTQEEIENLRKKDQKLRARSNRIKKRRARLAMQKASRKRNRK